MKPQSVNLSAFIKNVYSFSFNTVPSVIISVITYCKSGELGLGSYRVLQLLDFFFSSPPLYTQIYLYANNICAGA